MRRFEGRVALVVGGGADGPAKAGEALALGNGRAIALRLAAEGATVVVADIELERAQATVDALARPGLALAADTSSPEDCRRTVAAAEKEVGPLDVVIANTGISDLMPLRAQTVESFDRLVSVNVTGHWVTAQAALVPMLERGHGAFVFVGSTAGLASSGTSLAYEATKAAQLAVMRHIAVRYAPRGIRSNAVVLGVIDSTMVRREFGAQVERSAARDSVCPMRRQGTPEESAAAAAFLASDDASYVNGHCLVVDGGVMAAWPTPPIVEIPVLGGAESQ